MGGMWLRADMAPRNPNPSATGAVMAPADLDKKLADVQAAVESKIDGVQRDFGQQIADVKHALDGLARLMQKIDGDLQTRRSA